MGTKKKEENGENGGKRRRKKNSDARVKHLFLTENITEKVNMNVKDDSMILNTVKCWIGTSLQ